MTPEILTMIGMTMTVLIAIWSSNRSLRGEINQVRQEVRQELGDLRAEMHREFTDVRAEISVLSARVASAEGLVEGLRTAIARSVA